MPRTSTSPRKNAKPSGPGGGSTASLSSSPALEQLLREDSVGHISSDRSVIRQYESFLNKEWGFDKWLPPRSWYLDASKKIKVTDVDICNIRAMTIIAQHHQDKITSLPVLYSLQIHGFIRAAATSAESNTAAWKLSTSTRALNLMRRHFAPDLAARAQVQFKIPPPLSPKALVGNTASWRQDSAGDATYPEQHLSDVTTSDSTHTAANSPLFGPEEDGFRPGLHQTALYQVGNPDQPLSANVINFLQRRFKPSARGDINLIHPDYFQCFSSTRIPTEADHAETDRVVNGIRQRKESIAAIFHTWEQGHWTLASLWPNEVAKTLTVRHYDPAYAGEESLRRDQLRSKFRAWVQANFIGWKLDWKVVMGPSDQLSVHSGVSVVLGMVEWMDSRDIHPESWQSAKARDQLHRQVAQLDDQRTTPVHGSVQIPRRRPPHHTNDSPRRDHIPRRDHSPWRDDGRRRDGSPRGNDKPRRDIRPRRDGGTRDDGTRRDGSPRRDDNPRSNDSPLEDDSPVSVDSGVIFHRLSNSLRTPSSQQTHGTFPVKLSITQSLPTTPTANSSLKRKRSKAHWTDSPPTLEEEPAPPSKKTYKRHSRIDIAPGALTEMQEMAPRFIEIRKKLSELDFDELSAESLATARELEDQIKMLRNTVEDQERLYEEEFQNHRKAEQREAYLNKRRQHCCTGQCPETPEDVTEETNNVAAEVTDDIMPELEHIFIKKTEAQRRCAQEAAQNMREAKIKGDEARHLVIEKDQMLSDVQTRILATVQLMFFEGVGQGVCDAFEKGLQLDRDSARTALPRMLRERKKRRGE